MPRYAVIDVGTNSVKFHLAERGADGAWCCLADRVEVTRLGEGLQATGGCFTPSAMQRTIDAIAVMVAEARQHHVDGLAAVGTMGLRTAGNRAEFIDALEQRCGLRVEVIPGTEEARLGFVAVQSGLGIAPGSLTIFDTGGGSSQFTFGRDGRIAAQFSLNVGAVRFMEAHGLDGAISPDVLAAARAAIWEGLAPLADHPAPEILVGMGGAVTNLTAVMLGLSTYQPERIQGARLSRTEVERQIDVYRTRSAEERRHIPGLQPKRADIILAGACIVATVMDRLRRDAVIVSDRGLRHGLLVDRFGR